MILQALLGPFAQQALAIPIRQATNISYDATIGRSLTYTIPDSGAGVGLSLDGSSEVDQAMKYAIVTGLMRDGVNPSEVQGSSSTGNCTFGTYNSVAVCASVEDVTSDIVPNCKAIDHWSGVSDDECTYSLPTLNEHPPFRKEKTTNATLYLGASMIYQVEALIGDSSIPINDTLIEFYSIYRPNLTIESNYSGQLVALKGALKLCSQTYNSSIQFGVTTTTILDQSSNLNWTLSDGGHISSVPNSTDTIYMDGRALLALSLWLITDTFLGTAQMSPPPKNVTNAKDGVQVPEIKNPPIFSTTTSQQIATHLYGSANGYEVTDGVKALSDLLNNVAISMTNA